MYMLDIDNTCVLKLRSGTGEVRVPCPINNFFIWDVYLDGCKFNNITISMDDSELVLHIPQNAIDHLEWDDDDKLLWNLVPDNYKNHLYVYR